MYEGTTWFAADGFIAIITFLPLMISIILTSLGIYVAIKFVQFMRTKISLDKQRNEQLNELIIAVKRKEMEE
ncbi:hypothetical protein JOC78_001614 [Bacillus ectoiniformans]|uniref:hypothetical protein n=1 Tax=Bacillus ectoiniformans TaxID=1494429 RepID=UPI00195A8A94|nr:hypothetical protein [Bacillus ectoiniformans]MBM7648668.1 hypothetical protein [Bacillus ectoiniformans]